ncbi:dNA repair protein RadC [Firmicutes bacterium CAG:822]|nr:dNA repair protein RadC [Firmicutes bacterium CAG:822]
MSVKLKELPVLERPRERLINVGVENLSDEELLSIILKTGSKEMSVKELAAYILSNLGGIESLKNINYHEVKKIKGIGEAKACMLVALSEIARRMNRKVASLMGVKLNTPLKIFEFYKSKINDDQEQFYCIYLDASKKVIEEKLLFIGTVNYSLVHPRDIFKEAYLLNATGIICVHNHPSGEVRPSKEDINLTIRLKEIGVLMGVRVIDHIIIGDDKYYSFLENGKI